MTMSILLIVASVIGNLDGNKSARLPLVARYTGNRMNKLIKCNKTTLYMAF